MDQDIRSTTAFRNATAFFEALYAPGQDRIVSAFDAAPRPNSRDIAFTGSVYESLVRPPQSLVCVVNADSGALRRRTPPGTNERLPAWSPDGSRLALLSDRAEPGNFQLCLSAEDAPTDASEGLLATPPVAGLVEYLQWSPDGRCILLGVAGFGADLSGMQGGTTTHARNDPQPAWMPEVETGHEEQRWRHLWLYDCATGHSRQLSRDGVNVWEAAWCGAYAVTAVVSDSPSEGAWYTARVVVLDCETGLERLLYCSPDQVGWPSSPPSGRIIAFVEAVCSDRWVVCGELHLMASDGSAPPDRVDTAGVDVTHTAWRNEDVVTCAGRRGFETVVGEYDVRAGAWRELWSSTEMSIGDWYPSSAPFGSDGVAMIADGYGTPPTVAVIEHGKFRSVISFGHPGTATTMRQAGTMEPFRWTAPDGLEMQGWVVRPQGTGPWPLIMQIHGGPVHHHTNRWIDRLYELPILVERGYALFYPNPRGSNGRGKAFARHVQGDMGGADTYDFLSGIDALVAHGIADPARLGVTGRSYGGFMSSWLITQDARFSAALPLSPVTNWFSQHRTTQIPFFDELFLADDPSAPGGRYFARSPAMFAGNVTTPTLTVVGALDRNTPPGQGLEFHRSLLEHGVESVLVRYPLEGHGVRTFPARIDYTARLTDWFESKLGTPR
jgi:dipeptidyl aminopeptidase/acylaminoacyl peptidase